MQKSRWFYPVWALLVSGAWALHTATGFLDRLITAHSGKRSAVVGIVNSLTDAALVGPLGRPTAVMVIALIGFGTAIWSFRMRGDAETILPPEASKQDTAGPSSTSRIRALSSRISEKDNSASITVSGWSDHIASGLTMTDGRNACVDELLSVDSDVLRAFFRARMNDEEISPDSVFLTTEDAASSESIAKYRAQQLSNARRQIATFDEAFGHDPLPLTLDLYSRVPARRQIPTRAPELRRLVATFDAALDSGWLLSLKSQNPSLKEFNATAHDWQRRLGWEKVPIRLSDAQLRQALGVMNRLISSGASAPEDIDRYWYSYVVRAAATKQWPAYRNELIAIFSTTTRAQAQYPTNAAKLTEILIKETPLALQDIQSSAL